MPDLTDPALLHQSSRQTDGRRTAVGEPDHRPDAVLGRALGGRGHRLGLGHRVGERLLAEHVLACVQGTHGDVDVGVARGADVHEVDVVAGDQPGPVGLGRLPAESPGCLRHAGGVPAAEGAHPGPQRQVEEVWCGAPGLGMGSAHEGVPDHADAEGRGVGVHTKSFGAWWVG